MASLLRRMITSRASSVEDESRAITTIDDYATALAQSFLYAGNTYGLTGVQTTWNDTGQPREAALQSLEGYAQSLYASNGVIFACMAVRQLVFSAVSFQYQRLRAGRPSELFGSRVLEILETPWPGGTTQDMLSRMIQDVDLCGNSYWVTTGDELVHLRPDWCEILLEPRMVGAAQVGYRKLALAYYEGGKEVSRDNPALFLPTDVAHFAPYPDPLARYRGMTPLTSILREVRADKLMTRHREKFFENAATPNLAVRMDPQVSYDMFLKFKEQMGATHEGVDNAYKTLYFGAAADVTVIGQNFEQMSFKTVQGAGETRIAAAFGVPPIIVGLSEGLESATYSNYSQARRRFADGTMHPLWQNVAGSIAPVVPAQGPGTRLWYDARDVPFLREDEKDAAAIAQTAASTIETYVRSGFTPESSIAAYEAGDRGLLVHSGLFSVQLQSLPDPNGSTTDGEVQDPVEDPDVAQARTVAELVQKLYLGVGIVVSKEEARNIANRAGAQLPAGLPPELVPVEEAPAPDPVDEDADPENFVAAQRVATLLGQLTTSTDTVITKSEARLIANEGGASLEVEAPEELTPPAPQAAPPSADGDGQPEAQDPEESPDTGEGGTDA